MTKFFTITVIIARQSELLENITAMKVITYLVIAYFSNQ